MRLEVTELRASRERLAVASDADRRRLERELHEGPQQRLIALAVELQLARGLIDGDPDAAKALLADMERDLQLALEEATKLAHRIYPPLLDAAGLAAALRAAAVTTGARVRIEVAPGTRCPSEIAGAVYFSWLDVLERAGEGARASIAVRVVDDALVFEVAHSGIESLGLVRDRVEALGGTLAVQSDAADGTRVSASLPLPR